MPTAAALTLAAKRQALSETLRQADIDSPDTDARLLIAFALGLDRTMLFINGERPLSTDEIAAIDALVTRRLRREPVSRIFGRKEFWSLSLDVTGAVLVPRPETETVVEAALDFVVRGGLRLERLRVLDIGTGSGALMLALLSELENATGIATDISQDALAVARGNAERLSLAARCDFVLCNIVDAVSGRFDLIVSNPPYIAHSDIATLEPEVRDYDPALALDGGIDGLDFYRAIAAQAQRLLAPGGRLIVELGAGQEAAVHSLFVAAGLSVNAARTDLAGIPRSLSASMAPQTSHEGNALQPI